MSDVETPHPAAQTTRPHPQDCAPMLPAQPGAGRIARPFAPEGGNGTVAKALAELREEIAGGLLYTHSRAHANTARVLEAASFLYALIEILDEKGLIAIPELDARKDVVAERLKQRYVEKGMGVHLLQADEDKYTPRAEVQIDCETRLPLCQAVCCRLWFPLSRQDVDEGIVHWDLRYPYIIAQDAEGHCRHLDQATCGCTVYAHRPLPCRAFDCRNDPRIWSDFDKRVINPDLEAMFPPGAVPSLAALGGR